MLVTIVDASADNACFTTLVAALQATGLDSVLADTDTDFTVSAIDVMADNGVIHVIDTVITETLNSN